MKMLKLVAGLAIMVLAIVACEMTPGAAWGGGRRIGKRTGGTGSRGAG